MPGHPVFLHEIQDVMKFKPWMPGSRLRRGFDGLDASPPKL